MYRLFGKWGYINKSKAGRIMKSGKVKNHHIINRGWNILATDEEWEMRERLTVELLLGK